MKTVIIEDEKPAVEHLLLELRNIDPSIEITQVLGSVKDSIEWFNAPNSCDIVLMDIHLSDGLSFNIFQNANIQCPVIFITAYDKYLTDAFKYNSLDYILKPVHAEALKNAIKKYKNLQTHFTANYNSFLNYLGSIEKKKSRILVKKGMEFQMVKLEDVAYFFTEHKLVFLVDKDGKKFLTECKNLTEVTEMVDGKAFYRANRKYVINVNFIKRFKPLDKVKISVELFLEVNEDIVISQENAADFKNWIHKQ